MEIVFEETNYSLKTLNDLRDAYPEASKLVQFIKGWIDGDTSFQLQTSGSTGTPKIIHVSREQIIASVEATSKFLRLKSSHQALICLDPNFVASIMMAARCLLNDMDCLVTKPSSNPIKSIDKRIDFASFVPFQIYKMMEENTIHELSTIKNILVGGAPLTHSGFETLANINTNIFVTYGMTETVSHIALMRVKGIFSDAYYEVLPGIQIGQDTDGCLHITGAVTEGKKIQTNDSVEMLDKNKFRWLGRRDHVINSGGIKIHPEQIEKSIERYFSSDFMISWNPSAQLGNECILLTENQAIPQEKINAIEKLILKGFSKFHVPKKVIVVKQFERTSSGKVKREATRMKALELL
ncbi:AMP-binding protein [Reichenbachiella sp.]|uniref:AMP-binding protein n=1 Tax=Reichenbachiella sp. TaxID=2184521 RepID=UPI003B5A5FA4